MINSTVYFVIVYAAVALWATGIVALAAGSFLKRKPWLFAVAALFAWAGPAVFNWLERLLTA